MCVCVCVGVAFTELAEGGNLMETLARRQTYTEADVARLTLQVGMGNVWGACTVDTPCTHARIYRCGMYNWAHTPCRYRAYCQL